MNDSGRHLRLVDNHPRVSLRHEPRNVPVAYVIHARVNDSVPSIWRRLAVRSDLMLSTLHEVLVAAFDWHGGHLHRFAIGGDPFDRHAEVFVCVEDMTHEFTEEDAGTLDTQVRLDEVLSEPGHELAYVYDYGDNWDLTIRLEAVEPLESLLAESRAAQCLAGERAAPPEDCGGLRTAAELGRLKGFDPTRFDRGEVNLALNDPFVSLRELGLHADLVAIATRLRGTPVGDDLVVTAATAVNGHSLDDATRTRALFAIMWFLDHVGTAGLALTSAGYLKPTDVTAAMAVLPNAAGWIGKGNREVATQPVLDLRTSLQEVGLVRKFKGRLVLTKAGATCRSDASALRRHLVTRLRSGNVNDFEHQVVLLNALAIAARARYSGEWVMRVMNELGWRVNGALLNQWQVSAFDHPLGALLANLSSDVPTSRRDQQLSDVAIDFARSVVITP